MGLLTVILLAFHTMLVKNRKERNLAGELMGVLGLTLSSPAVYYVGQGKLDQAAVELWIINVLYFISSVFYVRMLISRTRNKNATNSTKLCILYHLVAVVIIYFLIELENGSALLLIPFIPVFGRTAWGLARHSGSLNVRKIGFAEMGLAMLFMILAVSTIKI